MICIGTKEEKPSTEKNPAPPWSDSKPQKDDKSQITWAMMIYKTNNNQQ